MVQPAERADARANRVRILTTAVSLFAEQGIDAEMREIAHRAGLGVGTVYNHFPKKDDLVVAVLDQAFQEMKEALGRAADLPDAVAAVRTFLDDGLAVAERYGALMTAISEGRIPAAHKAADNDSRREALGRQVVALVARGVAEGAFRRNLDIEVAAGVLRSVFLPSTLAELRRTRSTEEIAETVLAIFLDGARA